MRKYLLVIVSLSFIMASVSFVFADDAHKGHNMPGMSAKTDAPATGQNVVDVKNKTCPVSGEPVNGSDFVVYNGKRYGICCKGCDQMFLKDPQKYIKLLQDKEGIH